MVSGVCLKIFYAGQTNIRMSDMRVFVVQIKSGIVPETRIRRQTVRCIRRVVTIKYQSSKIKWSKLLHEYSIQQFFRVIKKFQLVLEVHNIKIYQIFNIKNEKKQIIAINIIENLKIIDLYNMHYYFELRCCLLHFMVGETFFAQSGIAAN